MEPVQIRPITDADLETADAILSLDFEGPVSRIHDLRNYRRMQPDGWFLALRGDRPAGMVGAIVYGAYAHIGLMAVHPEMQRQGIGLALMQYILARLDREGVPQVVLDASRAGQPLYEKLGFVAGELTHMFRRKGDFVGTDLPSDVRLMTGRDLADVAGLDATAFGANRLNALKILLEACPQRAFITHDESGQVAGYLIAQENRIGPCVAILPEYAERLLQAALTLSYQDALSVAVPSENRWAVGLLPGYGFELSRSNRHMVKGPGGFPGRREMVYAQASLAIG
jgi:ribosomal protein S18 acetylase RimI-like enzyme